MERAASQKHKERKAGKRLGSKVSYSREWGWELPGEKQSPWTVGKKMRHRPLKNKQMMPNNCLANT